MNKKTHDIEFNVEGLISSVETVAAHVTGRKKQNLRTTSMAVPKPAPELTPSQVRAIRTRLKVSQSMFAAMLNVPVVTAVSWEKGRRSPSGAALRLLEVVKTNPALLMTMQA